MLQRLIEQQASPERKLTRVLHEIPPRDFAGRGTAPFDAACGGAQDKLRLRRSAVEGFFGLGTTPPPGFAWSPSPANAGEDFTSHQAHPSSGMALEPTGQL